jgi:hypothetical protein
VTHFLDILRRRGGGLGKGRAVASKGAKGKEAAVKSGMRQKEEDETA